ncbi:hypothetical protein [uncultured Psychroserpens sp.]|uniref:hypothetical protein n=1 Tax=uncultured Psychroserpens sp. TaxID=255436 RepID=UPI0026367B08|nr:hypothetical protein [uncultured Psychroserpens sp.]
MEVKHWIEISKIAFALIGIFLTARFALRRMKENIRLTANLKWKEDFRLRLVEFLNTSLLLSNKAISVGFESEGNPDSEFDEFIEMIHKLHTNYYALEMMLDLKDERTNDLTKIYRSMIDNFMDVSEGKEVEENEEEALDSEFYIVAKEIYDEH